MVKPRTAGTRETRVAAATENFMASVKGRWKSDTGCGRRQQTEVDDFTPQPLVLTRQFQTPPDPSAYPRESTGP